MKATSWPLLSYSVLTKIQSSSVVDTVDPPSEKRGPSKVVKGGLGGVCVGG